MVADNLFIGDFDYIFVGAPFRARLAANRFEALKSLAFLLRRDGFSRHSAHSR